jgi:cyclomaltodextrinase
LQNLIDSHDTDRVASMIVNAGRQSYAQPDRYDYDVSERVSPRNTNQYDVQGPNATHRRIQRMVALMQMTFVGAPMIYYGTEAGMWGADDPGDRQPMVWEDLTYDDQAGDPLGRERRADPIGTNQPLYQFYRAAIRLRKLYSVLREGTFQPVASDNAAKFFAFKRQLGEEVLYVAFNRGDQPYVWRPTQDDGHALVQIFCASGETNKIAVHRDQQGFAVTLPALECVVLERQPWQE